MILVHAVVVLALQVVAAAAASVSLVVIRPGCIDDQYAVDYERDLRVLSRSDSLLDARTSTTGTGSGSSSSSDSLGGRSSSVTCSTGCCSDSAEHSGVFRGVRRRDGRDVIVKRIAKSAQQEALKEAELMAFLDGVDTTMRLYDVVENEQYCYLVMQYFQGRTVREYLRDLVADSECGFQEVMDRIRFIAGSVARTLTQFLDRGVMHWDLHSLNVLIDADDNVAVIDLGQSRTIFDHWLPNYELNLIRYDSFNAMQSRNFKIFLKQLFQIAECRSQDLLVHDPLYQRVVLNPRASLPIADLLTDDAKGKLRGENAARRYRDFHQSFPLRSALGGAGAVRPVVSDAQMVAQARFWEMRRSPTEPSGLEPEEVATLLRSLSKRSKSRIFAVWLSRYISGSAEV